MYEAPAICIRRDRGHGGRLYGLSFGEGLSALGWLGRAVPNDGAGRSRPVVVDELAGDGALLACWNLAHRTAPPRSRLADFAGDSLRRAVVQFAVDRHLDAGTGARRRISGRVDDVGHVQQRGDGRSLDFDSGRRPVRSGHLAGSAIWMGIVCRSPVFAWNGLCRYLRARGKPPVESIDRRGLSLD